MKKTKLFIPWHKHLFREYYFWSAVAGVATGAVIVLFTFSIPTPGSAKGLSRPLVAAGDPNVTPMEKVPKVPPAKESKGKTLQQQCQEKVARQHWGICCSPPDYITSDACQNALKGSPPPEPGGEEAPLTPAEIKLLPVALQKEISQIKEQIRQYEAQAAEAQAEATRMANCEIGCPGGAGAIQCTEEDIQLCVSHDNCIRACDKNYPQLKKKIDQLKKKEADILKRATALKKKVDAYKLKNKRKFRALEGAKTKK